VGSWVREAALRALETVAMLAVAADKGTFTEAHAAALLPCVLQQALEKLDKIREVAGNILEGLVLNKLPHMPHRDVLEQTIVPGMVLDWSSPQRTYPLLVPLIDLPAFTKRMTLGVCDAAGTMGRAQAEHAAAALLAHLSEGDEPGERQRMVMRCMVDLLAEHARQERVVLSILKTLNHMFCNDALGAVEDGELWEELFAQLRKQVVQSKKITKIQAGVQAIIGMLGVDCLERDTAKAAMLFTVEKSLAHQYPRVRAVAADALYNALLVNDALTEDDEDASEAAQELLLESPWEAEMEELEEPRGRLIEVLGLA